jgi:hypothetical protein
MECAPAFNYARDKHTTSLVPDDSIPDDSYSNPPHEPPSVTDAAATRQNKALFQSADLTLDLRYVTECTLGDDSAGPYPGVATRPPRVELKKLDLSSKGHLGEGVYCEMDMEEGQAVTFVLRVPPEKAPSEHARPSRKQAEALGVPIQSAWFCASLCLVMWGVGLVYRLCCWP